MKLLFLDLFPAYIPFIVQCTKAAGDKIDPTVDNLIVYEEGGADATFDSTQITGSPFDPAQVNAKTGLWGVLIAKTAFTVGKFYLALWEITVDAKTTAKIERYFACNSASFKADVSGLASQSSVNTIAGYVDTEVQAIKDKTDQLTFTGNNVHSHVKAEDNIDFGALQKTSLNAATPASVQGNVEGNVVGSVGSLASQAQTDVKAAMTSQGYTTTRAGYLDTLNGLVAAIWNALTSSMTTVGSIGKKLADWAVGTLTSAYDAAKSASSQTSVNNNIGYTQNVLSRLGDFAGSTPNDIMGFLRAIMRKDEGILPTQVGGDYDNQTDSLQALRDNPGGGGGGGTIILPVMEGAVYSSLAVQDKEVNIIRGDTPTIFFDLHGNYTGWTAKFGAKVKPKDTEYIIPVKNCTWTDASKGQGYFELTSTETANEAKLIGEIELSKDTKHLTAMRFILRIIEDVIK